MEPQLLLDSNPFGSLPEPIDNTDPQSISSHKVSIRKELWLILKDKS